MQTKLNSGNFEYESSLDVDKNHIQLGLYWALWLVIDCTNFDARPRFRLNDIQYPVYPVSRLFGEKK